MKVRHNVRRVLNINNNIDREKHREELRFKAKEDYEENKERILIKVECPICKIQVIRKAMARHERTKRHQDNMNQNQTKETKQEPEPKNIEKEKERVRRQQTIDYINDTFPSYQELGT